MDIIKELVKQFKKQKESPLMPQRAIVFWYDTNSKDRDLEEIREVLKQYDIKVWELKENNIFQTKVMLEMEETKSSFLIYAPFDKPKDEDNYLLDILLYAGEHGEFQADEIAITMKELGIDHLAIRPFIEKYWTFFNEKRRKEKFHKLLPIEVTEEQVKLAMLAVLTGSSTIQVPEIVRNVIEKGLNEDCNDAIQKIDKFFSTSLFYEIAESYFGVKSEGGARLKELVNTIVYNHFISEIDFELPSSFSETYPSYLPNTCRVFLDDWFLDQNHEMLDHLLQRMEGEWGIADVLMEHSYTLFERCDTFPIVDSILIDALLQQLLNETVNVSEWEGILAQRRMKHWYHSNWFSSKYELLEKALDMYKTIKEFELIDEPRDGIEWFSSYTKQYYKVDQRYRKFMNAYQQANHLDMFDSLVNNYTNWYENKYLEKVAMITEYVLDAELAEKWSVFEALKQKDFYRVLIQPLIEATKERIFVIISDALRFEAGEELKQDLQTNLNSEVSLIPMQASLPSYTQLGMASLLPGKISGIKEDGTVEVNGYSSKGLSSRERILQQREPDSRAYQLSHFLSLHKEDGLKELKGKRIVYLYHDRIDETGDSGKSEFYTYGAVEQAITDIKQAVKKLTGTYAASRIFITSDHGFLFQSTKVENRLKTGAVKGDITDSNRRFVIGQNLQISEGARKISLDYIGLDKEAAIAKGLNRFLASGTLKFVHGGAMPQETIVPVIEYRQIKGKDRKKAEERVNVHVASRNKVITNYRFKVAFFQEKKISDKLYPRSLRVAFYQGNERISNEMSLTFDSTKEALERQLEITFSLIENEYKTGDRCILRMEDVSTSKTDLYNEEEFELRLYHIK